MLLPSHLANRIQRRMRVLVARARYKFGLREPDPGSVEIAATFHHPVEAGQKALIASQYRALFPNAVEMELAEAQQLLNHRFRLLGHTMEHDARIAWSCDPVSGCDWSRGFSPDIQYRGPARLGDIKLAWELNKHQYFFTLGKAAWLKDDPAFAMEIVRQIDHWIADNPCQRGIHWISALETGTRAVSWIMAYPFYAEYCDAPFRRRLSRSLAQHMVFVEANLSLGPFTNTHLVGEAAALVAGGLFLACRQSRRWIDKGLAILAQEMIRQVAPDGVHTEQSIAYHRFFLDHYFLVNTLLTANGRSLPSATLRGMERMTEFLMDIIHPDGSVPSFGDSDDARGLWFHADCPADFRSLLALGAALFGRGDFKAVANKLTEEVFWLMGNRGVEKFRQLAARPPDHTSVAYPDSGYYVMRGGWDQSDPVLAFDCGPLGKGSAGHGHADALSFQIYANGYPFLVDPGTFSYNLDYAWRDTFRSTRAHNTIIIDSLDQSVPKDRMSWKSLAVAQCRHWVTTRWFDLADGEHDGYRRLPKPLTHRRIIIFFKPDTWCIWDQLEGTGRHLMESLLHLRPDCSIEAVDASALILQAPDGKQIHIWVRQGVESPEVVTAGDEKAAAWFSPGYGMRVPAHAIRIGREFAQETSLVMLLSASDRVKPLLTPDYPDQIGIRREDGAEEIVFYRVRSGWLADRETVRFDGRFLYRRKVAGAHLVVWAGAFHELLIAGLLDVRSAVIIQSLALENGRCELVLPPEDIIGLRITVQAGTRITINGHSIGDGNANPPYAHYCFYSFKDMGSGYSAHMQVVEIPLLVQGGVAHSVGVVRNGDSTNQLGAL